jgi:FAD/FMN-containing dehydrogenase
MNAIKDALDPLHILNDQKSYIKGDTDHAEPF